MSKQKVNMLESIISVNGRIFWNDGRRRIDLKKPIRDIFEPLENSQARIKYKMELCLSKRKLLKRTEELLDQEVIPILLYFTKEDLLEET
jgi:hypothetical protein